MGSLCKYALYNRVRHGTCGHIVVYVTDALDYRQDLEKKLKVKTLINKLTIGKVATGKLKTTAN